MPVDLRLDPSIFRTNLQNYIDSHGMTVQDFAAEVCLPGPTISRYLSGQRLPDITNALRVARRMHVSVEWLFGVKNRRPDSLSEDLVEIAELYSQASEDDRIIINTVLRKYRGRR